MDVRAVGVIVALVVTAVLWAAAFVLGRVDLRVTAHGLRNGALIAAALFGMTVVIVTFVYNGRAVFVDTLDLAGAFELGLIVGAVVAIGYLWLGAVLIAIGLIFRSKPQWSTLGAWAAVPVIVVSMGFGYVSYRSVAAEGSSNSTANGSMSITVNGVQTEPIVANGAATCSTAPDGTLTVAAGTAIEPRIMSSDGRLTSAAITLSPDGTSAQINMTMAGLQGLSQTAAAAPGSTPSGGQLAVVSGSWSGTVTWSCDQ